MDMLTQFWLLQSIVIFLVIGSFAALVAGLWLVFRPEQFQRICAPLNRRIGLGRSLESSINFDPWFYRHRKINSTLILLGALYALYFFSVQLDRLPAIEAMAGSLHYPQPLVGRWLDAVVLVAMTGALCAIFVALFILFRPSLLRDIEQEFNQWLSLRRVLEPLEMPRDGLDRLVLRFARQSGILLLLGGLYTLVLLLEWLGHPA